MRQIEWSWATPAKLGMACVASSSFRSHSSCASTVRMTAFDAYMCASVSTLKYRNRTYAVSVPRPPSFPPVITAVAVPSTSRTSTTDGSSESSLATRNPTVSASSTTRAITSISMAASRNTSSDSGGSAACPSATAALNAGTS